MRGDGGGDGGGWWESGNGNGNGNGDGGWEMGMGKTCWGRILASREASRGTEYTYVAGWLGGDVSTGNQTGRWMDEAVSYSDGLMKKLEPKSNKMMTGSQKASGVLGRSSLRLLPLSKC